MDNPYCVNIINFCTESYTLEVTAGQSCNWPNYIGPKWKKYQVCPTRPVFTLFPPEGGVVWNLPYIKKEVTVAYHHMVTSPFAENVLNISSNRQEQDRQGSQYLPQGTSVICLFSSGLTFYRAYPSPTLLGNQFLLP